MGTSDTEIDKETTMRREEEEELKTRSKLVNHTTHSLVP
jgi:hypothetical protein